MRILFIYPEFPDTFWSFKHAVAFVGKKAANPPLGLVTVAALLPPLWEKRLIDVNVTPITDNDIAWADFIFIGAMAVQRNSTHEIIHRCKAIGKKIVAGGPLFTGEYDQFPMVDHFILNEAEITLPLFLDDLNKHTPKKVYKTSEYADLSTTPQPLWELLDLPKYDSMNVQFSRGCPFNCDFCNVTALLGHKPRVKSTHSLIAEIDGLYQLGWRRNIFIVDDNFIGNKRILKEEVLPALIVWRKDKKGCQFVTEASINLADDPDLLQSMAAAGFVSVFVGIETPDVLALESCHKNQNRNRNLLENVRQIQHAGIQVMGGFIVGFDTDTPDIFQKQVDFIQSSGIVTAMVGILQAPFGTPLYARLKKENRILNELSGDNTDGSTNIITKMDPNTLRKGYLQLLESLYSPKGFYSRVKTFLQEYKPIRIPITIGLNEVFALLKTFLLFGFLGKERWEFWKLFFWVIGYDIKKFPSAITFSVFGYHFRKIKDKVNHQFKNEAPSRKLSQRFKQQQLKSTYSVKTYLK